MRLGRGDGGGAFSGEILVVIYYYRPKLVLRRYVLQCPVPFQIDMTLSIVADYFCEKYETMNC